MEPCTLRLWLFGGSILLWLLASPQTPAEIIPDITLPVNSTVTPQGNTRVIEGGTPSGDNLFHSFREFSLSTGDTAFFNNDLAVRNIITRVTGGSRSDIDGTIEANGTANLFLINPNGIIFGQNASLQIGGSFVASTANSLKFADGTEFSATAPQTPPLLTLSVPIGLQFGSNPGEIVNQSQASPNGAVNINDSPAGLQVQSGRTLALVGGNVLLDGGNLTAAGGRIELGSVAGGGLVSLREIATGYALDYTGVQNFQDIQLQGAIIDASGEGGGAIQLQGRNIALTDASQLLSITLGAETGGTLAIDAAQSVNLSQGAFIATFTAGEGQAGDVRVRASNSVELGGTSQNAPSALASQVLESATGNGGNLTIETGRLSIQDGAIMDASTFGAGRAGNVLIRALDSVELIGTGTVSSPDAQIITIKSGIYAQVAEGAIPDAGDAGDLTIETGQLIVSGGAQISTAARAGGNGGILTVNASDTIELSGTAPSATADPLDNNRSGIFVSAESGATGNVGNLNITTGLLTVEEGARISADNLGSDNTGGNATLTVRQLIIQGGGQVRAGSFDKGPGGTLTVNAAESVQVIGTGTIASRSVPSELFTEAEASGAAGILNITTGNLSVQDGARVTVSSRSTGKAGDLQVRTRSIELDNSASISADTSGGGGNIELRSPLLILRRSSRITTNAEGSDITGGNITINADVLAAIENSDISANSDDFRGGRVIINAQGIFGTQFREQLTPESDITATGANSSLNGTVEINTPDVDPSQGLVNLPNEPVNVEVAQGCQGGGTQASVEFFNTGRGGLAPNPYEPISSSELWEDVQLPKQRAENPAGASRASTSPATPPNEIVEAQGWLMNEKGQVVLLAQMPATHSQRRCGLR
jgi:filamentous hemagglutinin family protein